MNGEMAINPEFGRRARMARGAMDQPPTFGEIGRRVGELLGREPFTSQAVGAWFSKGQEPESFDIVAALARALGCKPGWLAFGSEEGPPNGGLHAAPPQVSQVPTRSVSKRRVEAEPTRKKRGA